MEALESTKFQWYNGNIKDTKPRGLLSLKSFIFSHQKPKEKISVAFRKIEEAAKNGDKKLKAELKQTMLYYFTPSVIFNNTGTIKESSNGKYKSYRNYKTIESIWNKKGILQEESLNNLSSEKPKLKSIIPGDENVYKSNAYYQKITLDIFSNKINAIGESGHPQLRSACLVLGSRCGAGYLSAGEAMIQAEYLIKSNQYLQKGISGYIATAKWAINQGYGKPKYYQ